MKRVLRWMAGSTMAVAVFVVPGLSLADFPPPVEQGTFTIPRPDDPTGFWTTPVIEVTTTVIGVSWQANTEPGGVWVRASEDGSDWGPWVEFRIEVGDHGPDGPTPEAQDTRPASDPVYVGEADYVQFRGNGSVEVKAEWVETAGRRMSIAERISDFLDRLTWGHQEPAVAQPDGPAMVTRAEWGGDACVGDNPHELGSADRVQVMFVHHTTHGGDVNGYSPAEAKDVVYAICSYHVRVREFWDIGYSFLVDKYGVIYEGRGGGIESTTIGAHTGGFNSYSTGVAFIGDHQTTAPTAAAQEAFQRLAAWKLDVHHLDPNASVTVESLGSTLYDAGQMVTFRTISGHRDAAATACPGNACYPLIDPFRAATAPLGGSKIYGGWPENPIISGTPATGYAPTSIPVRFTEPMDWTMIISDELGIEVTRFNGSGTDAAPVWDGTAQGIPLPVGDYRVSVTAIPISGAAAPRPSLFDVRLGSHNPPFSDDDDSIHAANIAFIFDAGITAGCGGDRYCPRDSVTRWEMAVFLVRTWESLRLPLPDYSDVGFEDIGDLLPSGVDAVNRFAQLGITSGTSPTTFDPYGEVSRWQMALFLSAVWSEAGLYDLPGGAEGDRFTDIQNLPEHVQLAIGQIAALGITSGTSPTTYGPDAAVTREQMATFLATTLRGLGWTQEES